MKIDEGNKFTADTIASILTSGLLGEVYVGLDVGGDTKMLDDGARIGKTQSAVVLEKLIGQFLFDKAAAGSRQMSIAAADRCRRPRVGAARRLRIDAVERRSARADEPRALPGARRPRHQHREAGRGGLRLSGAAVHAHRVCQRLQQHRRPLLRGQRSAAGQARQGRQRPRPGDDQHDVRAWRPDRRCLRRRHRARQRGLRPDVRGVGDSRRVRTCSFRCSARRRFATAPA